MNFNQKIIINAHVERQSWITSLCKDKTVIDVGFNDTGMDGNSLHNNIKKVAKRVVGIDNTIDKSYTGESYKVDLNGASLMTPPDRLRGFDILVAGEVIEHLVNPSGLFAYIIGSKAREVIITAPNAFAPHRFNENRLTGDVFEEIVHPEHFSWYSLFTLKRIVEDQLSPRYTIQEVVLIDNQNSIGIHLIKL